MKVSKTWVEYVIFAVFRLFTYGVALLLLCILGFIIYNGLGVMSWEFLTEAPSEGMNGGGIFPAIVGTFYLVVGSMLFAFPIGVMSTI